MKDTVPNVIIIGSMKSATTTLANLMDRHPGVCLSDPKEPEILLQVSSRSEAVKRYRTVFPMANRSALLLEASVAYTMLGNSSRCASTAKEVCGENLKLIFTLRDPVHRVESHIRHELNAGRLEEANVSESLRNDSKFLETSRYADQLQPWIEAFGIEQLLPIPFRDITDHPQAVARTVFDFLNLPQSNIGLEGRSHYNKSESRRVVPSFWKPFIRSSAYRQLIRPLIPKDLISRVVDFVTVTKTGSAFSLKEEDRMWISHELRDEESKLRLLLASPDFSFEGGLLEKDTAPLAVSQTQCSQL